MRPFLAWMLSATTMVARVEADQSLTVTVRDHEGRERAGVPVAIRSALVPPAFAPLMATSDRYGEARFEDIARFTTLAGRAGLPEVLAVLPLGLQKGEFLVGEAASERTLEIVLPPTGAVEVRWFGYEHGAKPGVDTLALLVQDPATGLTTEVPIEGGVPSPWFLNEVAAGVEIEFRATFARNARPLDFRLRGPERAGETVVREVAVDRSSVVLTGRLLHEDGRPVSNSTVHWRAASLASSTGQGKDRELVTAVDGHFQILGDERTFAQDLERAPKQAGEATRDPRAWRLAGEDGPGFVHFEIVDASGVVQASLARPFALFGGPELRDFGDLVLESCPSALRGDVRDDRGRALADAEVGLLERLEIVDEEGAASRVVWSSWLSPGTRSRVDGGFELDLGLAPSLDFDRADYYAVDGGRRQPAGRASSARRVRGRLHVSATKAEHLLARPCAISSANDFVHLRLGREGDAFGRILLERRADLDELEVQLEVAELESSHGWHRNDMFRRDGIGPGPALITSSGEFSWARLAPGLATLRIVRRRDGTIVREISGLDVRPGLSIDDPRLWSIDLRDVAR